MVRRITISFVATLMALVVANRSKGDTIIVTDLTANALTGVYTYNVEFSSNALVNSGDGFVLYDFQGLNPSTLATQVSFVFNLGGNGGTFVPAVQYVSNSLNNSAGVDFEYTHVLHLTDSPNIYNLTMAYSGPTVNGSANGILTIDSNVSGPNASLGNIGVVSVDSGGGIFASSMLVAPNAGSGPSTPTVPLPASFAGGSVLLLGLAVAGIARKVIHARSARLM